MRRIALVLAVLLLLSSLAGCAQSQISQEDYDALQVQYDALREEHDQTVQDLQAAEKAAQEAEDQLAAAEETIAALQAAAQETEGVKNRRVVVLDAEDPVAQKILGN